MFDESVSNIDDYSAEDASYQYGQETIDNPDLQ